MYVQQNTKQKLKMKSSRYTALSVGDQFPTLQWMQCLHIYGPSVQEV